MPATTLHQAVADPRALPRRVAAAWSARPMVGDAAVVVLLLVVLLVSTTPAVVDPGDELAPPVLELGGAWRATGWAWALQLALVLPLLWRRTAPTPAFLVIAAVAFAQWLAGPELYGDLAVLVALYTVVAHEPRRGAVALACGISVLGLVLAGARWATPSDAGPAVAIALGSLLALPVALGLAVRGRRRMLAATRADAARAERTRIAREMHDVVAHNLSVMVALSDGARATLARDPAAASDAIAHVSRTGREALAEMRRLLGILHADDDAAGPLRPQPGLDDLPELVEAVRSAGLGVTLDVDLGPGAPPPAGLALTVHRVVQEALTNVLKHAPAATQAEVRVRRTGGAVDVTVQDDGALATPVPATAGPAGGTADGLGLRGMAERVALHAGTVTAGPSGSGWRVHATLHEHGAGR
ncbi:sensor histidine kinase [Patulibacter americanus]|uniref:sensor histidine kinase n=1 Tax=Patulibacter americanus TaxID=588672 RepID=UPI0003B620E6|nr:histidine kinase [Patulibacter americanus]